MGLQPESHTPRHYGADAGHRHRGPAVDPPDRHRRAQHLIVEFVRRKNAGLTYTVQFANSPAGTSFQPTVNTPTVTPIYAN